MKKTMLVIVAALALAFTPSTKAQTTNNTPFTVPLGTNIVIQPAITESSVVVDRVIVDNVSQRVIVFLHGVPKPYVISGADFITFKAGLGPGLKAYLASYIAAHPPQ